MALATFTLTADLNDLLGVPVVDGDITIDIPGTSGSVGQIIDTATGDQFFVPKKVKPTSDGKLPTDVLLPFSDSASNPTGFQWRVSGTLVVLDGRGRREHVTMAPVTFTHNAADGATAVLGLKVSELFVPPTFTSTLMGLAADAQESADRAEAALGTVLAPTDDQMAYLASTEGTATRASLNAAFAEVVAPGLRRTRTRNMGILRPRIRDIATRVARTKPLIAATNITAAITNQVNTTLTAASPEHTYWGSVAWQIAAQGFCTLDPHSTTYNVPWVDEFITDSPVFAVEMTSGGQLVELLVNGEQVRAPAIMSGGAWLLVDWNGVRAMRRYTIRGQGGMAIETIRRNASDSLYAPKSDSDVKVAWMGDSYSQTLGTDGISTLPMLTCDMLGWKVAASVEGGTGYDQPNPATTVASFQARVPDVIAAAPDIVILAGGHNIRDTATEQASIVATIEALQAGLPGVPILAFGPFYGSGPTFGEAGYATEAAKIAAACAATGATFLPTTGWIAGTGRVGTPANDGNADVLISADATHPQTGIGGDYFAARCADAITASGAI